MPDLPRRIGVVANPDKSVSRAAVRHAVELIRAAGGVVLLERGTATLSGLRGLPRHPLERLAKQVDLLLVFGGDGTMLRVAREASVSGTPILGINVGSLGFLTAASFEQLPAALERVLAGRFTVESRPLIQATCGPQHPPQPQIALNDFVISRRAATRLIELEVSVDGVMLTRYRADGLIISSPTGSTAYSLAAGGAIVSPNAHVFTVTPICPHTLSNRSVIVSLDSVIEVKVLGPQIEILLAADGQVQSPLSLGGVVRVRRSRRVARLVRLSGESFFETLREKLKWSGSTV